MTYFKRIKIWCLVLKSFFLTLGGIDNNILDANQTVSEILKRKSLIRFGDGEFGIYRHKSIHYQIWSPELKYFFDDIKNEYENNQKLCPYILALPKTFMSVNGFELSKKRVYISSWSESRYDFKKNFNHCLPYGDSFLFEKKNKEIYSKIWLSDISPKTVIFVHNSKEYAKLFEYKYAKNVIFVKCPKRNAFESLKLIEDKIFYEIESNQLEKNNVIITCSAGPTGKVLVYKFSKLGYWCIDAGHCWDDPLEGI